MASSWASHPLVAEESRAVFGHAVTAHEADGLAHHGGAVAGVPELASGAEDVGQGVAPGVLDEGVGLQGGHAGGVAPGLGQGHLADILDGVRGDLAQDAHLGAAALDFALGEEAVLFALQGVQLVEEARGGKAQGGAGLASGPDFDQALEGVLLGLEAQIKAGGAGGAALAAAEPAALVADDWFDGREELGGGHEGDRHAGAAEDGLDDVPVAVGGDDDAVLDGVPADDPAGPGL